jgi:hypothetical protein
MLDTCQRADARSAEALAAAEKLVGDVVFWMHVAASPRVWPTKEARHRRVKETRERIDTFRALRPAPEDE